MATPEDIASVRRMADEPTTDTYTDDALSAILAREGSVRAAVYAVWQEKAAKYSRLVDTSESGSSRRNSQLGSNAIAMMKLYEPIPDDVVQASTAPTTYPTVRP